MGGMPPIMSHVPFGTPGGSLTTLGARSPYSFCTRSQAIGGSLTCPSAETNLKSGISILLSTGATRFGTPEGRGYCATDPGGTLICQVLLPTSKVADTLGPVSA